PHRELLRGERPVRAVRVQTRCVPREAGSHGLTNGCSSFDPRSPAERRRVCHARGGETANRGLGEKLAGALLFRRLRRKRSAPASFSPSPRLAVSPPRAWQTRRRSAGERGSKEEHPLVRPWLPASRGTQRVCTRTARTGRSPRSNSR